MKHVTFLVLVFHWFSTCPAQTVLNVRAFEEDGTVEILYDLHTTKKENEFYVTLKMSKDGGKIYTPIYEAIGQANKNVSVGSEQVILWHPEQPPGDSLLFKVEAGPRRSSEQLGNINKAKLVSSASGLVTISKVVRLNSKIEFTFSMENTRRDGNMFIAANFRIKDEKNHDYKEIVVSQNGKPGSVVICEPGSSKIFKITIDGVPDDVKQFAKVDFSLSEIIVSFSNVKIEQ